KLLAFFGTFGVDAATFKSTYESAGVQTMVQRADELGRRYRVASVPTIVVNGKYITDAGLAGGNAQLFALIGELAASERSGNYRGSERAQPPRGRVERRVFLREAEAHELRGRRLAVEHGDRDRRDAVLDREPTRELDVRQVRDRAVVGELKIRAGRRTDR